MTPAQKGRRPPIRLRSRLRSALAWQAGQAVVALPTGHFNFRLPKRLQLSVRFGLCLDDVGIGTDVAIESPDPVVVERVRSKTSDVPTGRATNVQILITGYVSVETIARRNV